MRRASPWRTRSTLRRSCTERLRVFRHRVAARHQLQQLLGDSPAMRRVREQTRIAAAHRTRVLITGPAGSGREHVARTIHYGGGPESAGPLAPLSCSSLDAELLHSTITAFLRQCAELETESPAALLLLDVDELAAEAQAVLADALNIAEFDLRTLATARAGLLQSAAETRFRHDLACMLSTLVIELPPLCQRQQDIPLLAQFFLEQANAAGGRQLGGFTPEALDQLVAYPWPGNVEEMAALIREASRRAEGASDHVGRVASAGSLGRPCSRRPAPRARDHRAGRLSGGHRKGAAPQGVAACPRQQGQGGSSLGDHASAASPPSRPVGTRLRCEGVFTRLLPSRRDRLPRGEPASRIEVAVAPQTPS